MASVIERLNEVLDQESELYEELLKVSRSKTPVIVQENLEELTRITGEEQALVDRLANLDISRASIME